MCTNRKRLMFGVIMLASLSLFLFGCGGGGGSPTAPALKAITGVVSDVTTGLPLSNATVTAYAIDANGALASTPLSVPATAKSDGSGNYLLKIPADYAGGVMVEATLPAVSPKVAAGKHVALATAIRKIRAILPKVQKEQTALPPVMLSLATEIVVQYIEQNKGANSFTSDNVQKAIVVLEPLLCANFAQTPPPASGSAGTEVQQDLIVMIQALNTVLDSGVTITELVKVDSSTGIIGLGTVAAELTAAIETAKSDLIATGTIPGSFTSTELTTAVAQAATTPVVEPDLSDKTAPSVPADLAATLSADSVALTWTASTDNVGVTAYYVYRDGAFIAVVTGTSFTDLTIKPATSYVYEVKARDAVSNVSAGSTVSVTVPAPVSYTISGKVTLNGAGLPGVYVVVTGSGSGLAVTDANGNYSITGAHNGNYTITPSFSGYAFAPVSVAIAVSNADATGIDFAAVANGSVVGGITYPDGIVIGGVVYPPGSIIGGATFPTGVVIGGMTYPISAVAVGTTFPGGAVTGGVTYPDGSVTGSVTYYYIVSGKVTDSTGAGLPGVTVTLSGGSNASTVTDALGNYVFFTSILGGNYTVTPTSAVYTFAPVSSPVSVTTGNQVGINFGAI